MTFSPRVRFLRVAIGLTFRLASAITLRPREAVQLSLEIRRGCVVWVARVRSGLAHGRVVSLRLRAVKQEVRLEFRL